MRFYLVYCATIFFILTVQTIGLAQNEKLDDPYISLPKTQQKISAPYHAAGLNYWTVQVNVDSDGNDILNDAANEPSIAINAQNPKHMVIGWRQFDDITNNFRQAGYAYTTDGGQHWTFPGVIQPGIFRSDPVLESDPDGNILYNSLAIEPNFHCTVFKNNGIGAWDGGVQAFGGDKQWMAVDKTKGPGKGNIYSNWSYGASSCEGDYARSIDNGASFESCKTYDPSSYWGTMAIGPDGAVYISAGNGTIVRSNNAQFKDQDELWDILYADYGGIPKSFQTDSPNPGGLLGQPWIATNHAQNNLNGQFM